MNIDDYTIEESGDGILILTPKPGSDAELLAQYKKHKNNVAQAENFRQQASDKKTEISALQEAARQQLLNRGIDPEA
jgi:hypothetical protein